MTDTEEKKNQKETDLSLLCHFQNGFDSQGWVRLKPRTRRYVSHVGSRGPRTRTTLHCLLTHTSRELDLEAQLPDSNSHSGMGCQCLKLQLNSLGHKSWHFIYRHWDK